MKKTEKEEKDELGIYFIHKRNKGHYYNNFNY